METKDTGKVRLSVEENSYLHAVIYTEGEIIEADIQPVTDYLNMFSAPVPALFERKGHYTISILVQITMMQQTKRRLKAVAFIERDRRDALMTKIAASTYFRDVEVRSFYERKMAVDWLRQFFSSTPLLPQARNTA
ncbi:MAG: hypothetical protein KZQ99_05675 [Candidatus Thiodiazotropha sp. (ex Dulcina madagascariensis)]|nr:hypothetical protein [Candidatus Thiodiazotropha sp. (ex Dulcina madagascariensis)]